jgi:arginine:pyruvate transaminase
MFALINVATTSLDGEAFAMGLLENGGVAVMPGSSFGENLKFWVRVALTIEDSEFERALDRIVAHVKDLERKVE